jgi:hypothetical protein
LTSSSLTVSATVFDPLTSIRSKASPPVEPAERVVDHVLGGGSIAQHDVREPGQPEGVLRVQRGHRRAGVVADRLSPRAQQVHMTETRKRR